jgi:hypothetical protein
MLRRPAWVCLLVCLVWLVWLGALGGCIGVVGQRLPPDVAASLRRSEMRRMETDLLLLYYPAPRREEALRFAARVEGCARALRGRAKIKVGPATDKMVVILPEVPFNNAFVAPGAVGFESLSVVPSWSSLDFATEFGLPPDPAWIGCHEIVHYVHFQQIAGLWRWMNAIFGVVLSPQVGLDAWFSEGLATYYESRLQPGGGRIAWPMWRGVFHAGVAGRELDGGDLSADHRDFHNGQHYLMGSHFVAFLVERYGEDWLWRLIEKQGESWVFALGVNWRFYSVYGRSLSTLVDEWAADVKRRYPVRARPAEERRVRGAGQNARYARAATGREALISGDVDRPAWLEVWSADGRLERSRPLAEILPPRALRIADPTLVSGLSFTADGRQLWFVAIDLGWTEQEARLVRYDVDDDRLEVVAEDVRGPGGGVSADGRAYWLSRADGDRHELARWDAATGAVTVVARAEPGQYLGLPRPSPRGDRVAVSAFDGREFVVWVVAADGGARVAEVRVPGGPSYDASWAGDERIVLLGAVDGTFQVFVHDLARATTTQVTHAPYLAFQPSLVGESLRFLSRQGWRWDVDEVRVAPPEPAPASEPVVVLPAPPPARPARPGEAPVTAVVRVLSDEPYSQLDHLFVPQMHALALVVPQLGNTLLGLSLAGGDRLELHRWALTGLVQLDTGYVSGLAGYQNANLAPWLVTLSGAQLEWEDRELVDDVPEGDPVLYRRQRDAGLSIGRGFGTAAVAVGGLFVEDTREESVGAPHVTRRMAGPQLSLSWFGGEYTAVGGPWRAVALSVDTAWFPEAWSTLDHEIVDVGTGLFLAGHVPGTRRHRVSLALRGRALLGSPEGSGELQLGGADVFAPLWTHPEENDAPDGPDLDHLPEHIGFFEPLRGFEDYPLALERVAVATLTWRWPLRIDEGWATTLYLFPSLFVRELGFELFAAGAWDLGVGDEPHAAAGASLSLETVFWRAPLALRYQIARRLTDDEGLVHTVGLGVGF